MVNPYKFPVEIKDAFDKILKAFRFYTVLWAGSIMTTGFYFMVMVPGVFKEGERCPSDLLKNVRIYIGTKDDIQLFQCQLCLYQYARATGAVKIGDEQSGDQSPFYGRTMYFFKKDNRYECCMGEEGGDPKKDELELFETI